MNTKELSSFSSFEEADEADRIERWAMSPIKRLSMVESLRQYMYPNGKPTPRLQRVLETVEQPSS
jgi:hypothetical protein